MSRLSIRPLVCGSIFNPPGERTAPVPTPPQGSVVQNKVLPRFPLIAGPGFGSLGLLISSYWFFCLPASKIVLLLSLCVFALSLWLYAFFFFLIIVHVRDFGEIRDKCMGSAGWDLTEVFPNFCIFRKHKYESKIIVLDVLSSACYPVYLSLASRYLENDS